MTSRSAAARVLAPTIGVAVATTAIAVLINFATDRKTSVVLWLAVVAATALCAGCSYWLYRRQSSAEEQAASAPGGTNVLRLGRNAKVGRARQHATRRNLFRSGSGSTIDDLVMRAGMMPDSPPPGGAEGNRAPDSRDAD